MAAEEKRYIKGFIYKSGIVHCSVCVPKDATKEEIEDMVNKENPVGMDSRWFISEASTFKTGEPNPCPCDVFPERYMHYLMEC